MGQHWAAGIATRRSPPASIKDLSVFIDKYEIAASSHRFYNEQHLVDPAGGVPLFAVELEHALQPRLAHRANSCISEVLSHQQTERGVTLDASVGELTNTVDTRVLQMRREQHVRAADCWREELDGQSQFIDKHHFLHPGIRQQRLQLVAYGCQGQGVKAHNQ